MVLVAQRTIVVAVEDGPAVRVEDGDQLPAGVSADKVERLRALGLVVEPEPVPPSGGKGTQGGGRSKTPAPTPGED